MEQACQQIIEFVQTSEKNTKSLDGIMKKMVICEQKLIVWNKESFGNVFYKLRQAQHRLQNTVEAYPTRADREDYYNTRKEVQLWMERE